MYIPSKPSVQQTETEAIAVTSGSLPRCASWISLSIISSTAYLRRMKGFDIFFVINAFLFILMCIFAHYARWTQYAGTGKIAVAEFFFYATVLMAVATALWIWLRRYHFPWWLLTIIEFGILIQFAGGLIHFGGARLYDHVFFYIRFDKYVHFINSFIAAVAVSEIIKMKGLPINGFTRFLTLLVVLGLGSLIEISEYTVTLTISSNGVGGYDDNMRDMIANGCGGIFFLVLSSFLKRRK
jgi:hypothetical protein